MSKLTVISDLNLNEEQLEAIEQAAACNYAPSQIATYLGINQKIFLAAYHDPESLVRHHYDKGILTSQFEIYKELVDNAKGGNITAVQIFEKAQDKVQFDNYKNRILNEG